MAGIGGIGLPGGQSAGTPGGRVVVVTGGSVVVVGFVVDGGSVVVDPGSVVVDRGALVVVDRDPPCAVPVGTVADGADAARRRCLGAERGVAPDGEASPPGVCDTAAGFDTRPAERVEAASDASPTTTLSYSFRVRVITPAPGSALD